MSHWLPPCAWDQARKSSHLLSSQTWTVAAFSASSGDAVSSQRFIQWLHGNRCCRQSISTLLELLFAHDRRIQVAAAAILPRKWPSPVTVKRFPLSVHVTVRGSCCALRKGLAFQCQQNPTSFCPEGGLNGSSCGLVGARHAGARTAMHCLLVSFRTRSALTCQAGPLSPRNSISGFLFGVKADHAPHIMRCNHQRGALKLWKNF